MILPERLRGLERRELESGLTLLVASTASARRRGLAGLDELPAGHALLLEPCRSIQTIGMRFALDVVWLDAKGAAIRLDSAVAPRRMRTCLRASAVIECNAGEGERFAQALLGS
jgi:uncharacterized membrane protein (UPF0127 family)